MDFSVVLAADVLLSSDTRNALILVGQRSVAGGSGNQEQTVCIVSDAIPCAELDVIMEQVECLEQVLPCGIAFLGVFLPGDGVKDLAGLRHSLSSHLQVSSLFVAKYDKEGRVQCRLLQSGRMLSVNTPDTKPVLVTLACYFFSPLGQFPFIVRSKDENITSNVALGVTSTDVMEHNEIWASVDALYAVQLGSTEGQEKDMLCVHVTFFPFLSCGQDVYRAICTLLPKVEQRPQCVMVRVGSQRYPSLVYQWIFTPTERGSAALSMKQWDELRELIEDGVGEEVQPSQVVTDTFLGVPSVAASTTIKGSTNMGRNKTQANEVSNASQLERAKGDFLKYMTPLLVLLCSLLLYFCCSK
ncbi:hypothetical protein MOQ_002323 [Trypanosoma cruzi marinkellei]|uniref:Uncharacterized protein n=1 Tax=Trypanosoma cruzi marinkellei TaxID=85056 RepID=K2ND86_TRYCR|nr:hypothetical protein MOQ_002323 [Trypanosoma cruzi marinkellei]